MIDASEKPDGARGRAGPPLLDVQGISVEFATGRGWARVVDDVSFDLRPGKTLGIVGESGSGKTISSLAIMGLLPPREARLAGGRILFDGADISGLGRRAHEDLRGNRLAMVFQEPMTSLNPAFSVGDQIAETIRRHKSVSGREARTRSIAMLDQVGIPNASRRFKSYPHEFSGGMRQRVCLAIALCCDPELLIADEATTALDVTVQAQILELLKEMRDELSLAILFISHDLGVVADICDQVAVMYAGQVVESGEVYATFESPTHPYTSGLLAATPRLFESTEAVLEPIGGTPPPPLAMPSGCRFRPRCPHEQQRCAQEDEVQLRTVNGQVTRCIRSEELVLRGTNG